MRRWRTKPEPITVKNPRANAVVEHPHEIMADMLQAQLACRHENDDPISDMLQAAACGVRSTAHGTTGHAPGQLAHDEDVMLCAHMAAGLELV